MSLRLRVHRVVRLIPPGRVATYAQVAALAGAPRHARHAGAALSGACEADDLPWHRVLNAQGRISPGGDPLRPMLQRRLLEDEGVVFSRSGRCNLKRFGWAGPPEVLVWEDEGEDEQLVR